MVAKCTSPARFRQPLLQLSLTVKMLLALNRNRWARLSATAILLLFVILKVHPERLVSAAGSANPACLLLALVLTGPFLYVKAARWHAMLRAGGIETTFGEATTSLVAGMGLALITPARVGEVARAAYLRDNRKLKIAGLVLVDKSFDVLVLVVLSIPGAWALLGPIPGIGLLGLACIGLLMVYRPRSVHRWATRVSSRLPGSGKLDRVLSSLEALTPRMTTLYLLLTGASFAVVLLQFELILLSWRAWSFEIVFYTFPLVVLTNVLPITIGGLGVREGAAVILLGHYGVSSAHAALSAFLMFGINTALPGIVGAALMPVLHALPRRADARNT